MPYYEMEIGLDRYTGPVLRPPRFVHFARLPGIEPISRNLWFPKRLIFMVGQENSPRRPPSYRAPPRPECDCGGHHFPHRIKGRRLLPFATADYYHALRAGVLPEVAPQPISKECPH